MARVIDQIFVGWDLDLRNVQQREARAAEKLKNRLQEKDSGKLVGSVVRFGVADGYAQYMIASEKPLTLVHLHFGDGYQIPEAHIRGLRLSDLRKQISFDKVLEKHLGKVI